jgi:hypothetical protein
VRKIRLLNNIDYLENRLERDYSIVDEVNGTNYALTFKHKEKEIVIQLLDRVGIEIGKGDIKISKLINALSDSILEELTLVENEIVEILRNYLSHNVLSVVFGEIDVNLGENAVAIEKVEYITKNVRYLDFLSLYNHANNDGWENIKANVLRLSTLTVPVVEIGLELRYNNYDDLNDYLILDDIDSDSDSRLVNDNQALYLLNLQELLDEYKIKSEGLSNESFEKIKHCIPAYFKVTIKTKQE